MDCGCTTYNCLDVVREFTNCRSILTLYLQAGETATYSWEYEFNGLWRGGTIEVTTGDNIVLPYVFNEYYIHLIKIYKANGDLLNDTCYKLDTTKLPGNYTTATPEDNNTLEVTITDESGQGAGSFTVDAINGRTVKYIIADPQVYTGFTQTGNQITMTNGVTYYDGQKILLVFE